MPKRLATVLLIAALLSGPAFAASQDVELTASVATRCTISGADTPSALVQDLVVDENGYVSTAPVQVTFPVYCNAPSTLILSSSKQGLRGPTAGNFAKVIHYVAQLQGGNLPMFLMETANYYTFPDGSSQARDNNSTGIDQNITIKITPIANTTPLASGTYSDTMTLTITPQQ